MIARFIWRKQKNFQSWSRVVAMAGLVAMVLGVGCRDEKTEKKKDRDENAQHLDVLYQEYLTGDIDNARQSISKSIDILGKVTSFNEGGRAWALCFNYCRLYCIEEYAGNENAAYLAFIKAKYWFAIERELSIKETRSTMEENIQKIKKFTTKECTEYVEKWDNAHTNGKGPVYARKKQQATTIPESKE
jgi:hypothetical protein